MQPALSAAGSVQAQPPLPDPGHPSEGPQCRGDQREGKSPGVGAAPAGQQAATPAPGFTLPCSDVEQNALVTAPA